MKNLRTDKIAVIGQGYVGLPLALEFAKHFPVFGFDINTSRIDELNSGNDHTQEADLSLLQKGLLSAATTNFEIGYKGTYSLEEIKCANIFIVTVPTPIDRFNSPDLKPLLTASKMIGSNLKKDDIVIYESTVYPGCTEEECIPVLENKSGLIYNTDFFVGYSPERIVPGDKVHTLKSIVKVTSGSTPEIAELIDQLYKKIVIAGTHKAPSIKVAEASKAIENAQRDVNISFVNELAKIFNLMGINTSDVLEAAGTKWNFLPFKPGLVGGHCISVDPYYLAQRAEYFGYNPEIMLAGRRINDSMAEYAASEIIKLMIKNDIIIKDAEVLVLGITFKENCPDVRNSKVVELVKLLKDFGTNITIYDPVANSDDVLIENNICNLRINKDLENKSFDAVIYAVDHKEFITIDISKLRNDKSIVYSVKQFSQMK